MTYNKNVYFLENYETSCETIAPIRYTIMYTRLRLYYPDTIVKFYSYANYFQIFILVVQ